MSKDANDNMGKPQRVDIDTNRNLVYIAMARDPADLDGDGVSDSSENSFGFDTYKNMADSYDFLGVAEMDGADQDFIRGYTGKVDDEIRARLAEREAMTTRPYCVAEDWAMPGCQSYDFFGPPECKRR